MDVGCEGGGIDSFVVMTSTNASETCDKSSLQRSLLPKGEEYSLLRLHALFILPTSKQLDYQSTLKFPG